MDYLLRRWKPEDEIVLNNISSYSLLKDKEYSTDFLYIVENNKKAIGFLIMKVKKYKAKIIFCLSNVEAELNASVKIIQKLCEEGLHEGFKEIYAQIPVDSVLEKKVLKKLGFSQQLIDYEDQNSDVKKLNNYLIYKLSKVL